MAKTIISEDIVNAICQCVSDGAYNNTACEIVGINESTLYDWINQEKKGGLFAKLAKGLKKAKGGFELSHIKNVSLDPEWQSSAWILERRFPERWAKKDQPIFQMNIAQLADGYKDLLVSEVEQKLLTLGDKL